MDLHQKIRKILLDAEIQLKAHLREKFLADLRAIRDINDVDEQKMKLRNMRKRLDGENVLSGDIFQSYMYSLRDVQDYDTMVQIADDFKSVPRAQKIMQTGQLQYLYAFALNRRNAAGDREKALEVCVKALEDKKNHFPDMLCLCGRIYKVSVVRNSRANFFFLC